MSPIDLYTWKTSNGKKATIMMEECELEYKIHPIDISTDIQFCEDFIEVNLSELIDEEDDDDMCSGPAYSKPTTIQ